MHHAGTDSKYLSTEKHLGRHRDWRSAHEHHQLRCAFHRGINGGRWASKTPSSTDLWHRRLACAGDESDGMGWTAKAVERRWQHLAPMVGGQADRSRSRRAPPGLLAGRVGEDQLADVHVDRRERRLVRSGVDPALQPRAQDHQDRRQDHGQPRRHADLHDQLREPRLRAGRTTPPSSTRCRTAHDLRQRHATAACTTAATRTVTWNSAR